MERQRASGSQRMRPDTATSTSRFASGARVPRPSEPLDVAPTLRLPSFAAPPRSPRTPPQSRPSPTSRALVRRPASTSDGGDAPLLVPPAPTTRLPVATLARPAAQRGRALPWARPVTFALVAITLVVALFFGAHQAELGNGNTPAPSGRAPWYAFTGSAAIATVAPPPVTQQVQLAPVAGQASSLEPCHDSTRFLASISQWAVPPGCYGLVYTPNPANYISRPGFGFCNWWVRVTHPDHPDITENLSYPRGTDPVAGAPIFFDGNEQGAESIGHWAVAVAVAPDHYWVLISEMNFAWRGAGFGKIDYRYIHVSPHVHIVYIIS